MWLNLLSLLMLVLITFFLSLQGMFSALILFVLSVVSSVVAFGFYENLYSGLLIQWLPGEGEAVSLMAIFLLTLLVLRLIVDLGMKGNVLLPAKADRVGGAVMGFFAGMVMTGMAMTAVQLLPFDHEILGFARYTSGASGRLTTNGLFLGPDSFASGLAGLILDGSLSGKDPDSSFEANHPDFLGQIDARRSAGPMVKGVKDASVSVERMWWPERLGANSPDSGMKYLAVRVKPSGAEAFTPAQFRLVARNAGRIQTFMPRGAGDGGEPAQVELLQVYSTPKTLDLVYQVPQSLSKAWYVAYNGWAKGEIAEEKQKDATPPAMAPSGTARSSAGQSNASEADKARQRNPGGRTHAANVSDDPYVSDDLPGNICIPTNDASEMELSGKKIASGRLVLDASKIKMAIPAMSITKFKVPDGKKLVQVPLQRVFAGSIYGQAINFADRTFQQSWSLKDETGRLYQPVGAFAEANVGGTDIIEIQYASQEAIDAGHTLGPWQRIQESSFRQPGAKLIFLYQVPPGTHIVDFQTNRGGGSDIDLRVP